MTTDREMLELAAKAADYDYECTSHFDDAEYDQHQIRSTSGKLIDWNPINDDGDALRLVVNLCAGRYWGIEQNDALKRACVEAYVPGQKSMFRTEFFEPWGGHTDEHKQAATRRAIVRAAAEIGKAMQESTSPHKPEASPPAQA